MLVGRFYPIPSSRLAKIGTDGLLASVPFFVSHPLSSRLAKIGTDDSPGVCPIFRRFYPIPSSHLAKIGTDGLLTSVAFFAVSTRSRHPVVHLNGISLRQQWESRSTKKMESVPIFRTGPDVCPYFSCLIPCHPVWRK